MSSTGFTTARKTGSRRHLTIGSFRQSSVTNISNINEINDSPPSYVKSKDDISPRSVKRSDSSPMPIKKENSSPITRKVPKPRKSTLSSSLKARRNTGVPRGPRQVTQVPGSSPLPVRIHIETPNIQRNRAQRETNEDLLLRQRKNEEFSCIFIVPRLVRAEIIGSCMDTVFDMKSKLISEVRLAVEDLISQGVINENELSDLVLPTNEYAFKSRGTNDYVLNETLPLQRVDFIQACTKAFVTPRFCLVEKRRVKMLNEEERKDRLKKEILLSNDIASLIGSKHTSNFLEFENNEIASFRRGAMKEKIAIQKKRKNLFEQFGAGVKDERITLLPEYVLGEPMPMVIPETFLIIAHLPIDGMKVTMSISVVEQACKVRTMIYNKYIRKLPDSGANDKNIGTDDDYILKVTGYKDFLYGENQMLSYDCVRKALSKPENGPLEINLHPLSQFENILNEINVSIATSIVDKLLIQEEESERDHSKDQKIFEVSDSYSVYIKNIQRLSLSPEQIGENCYIYISAEIYHAGHKLGSAYTLGVSAATNVTFYSKIIFKGLNISNIPLGSRILFTVYLRRCDISSGWVKDIFKTDEPICWVASQVFDQSYRLRDGKASFRMWVDTIASPIGSCYQNLLTMNAPIIFLDFNGQPNGKRIYYPLIDKVEQRRIPDCISDDTIRNLNRIISADPLIPLTAEDKLLIWGNRYYLSSNPAALPKFLLSLCWDDHKQVIEAHKMLKIWTKLPALQALELLDAKFADPIIRDFGIDCMSYMQDGECYDFMLQLTQVLKHEPYHNSALARFLLTRAWTNPRIGHCFFWFLKAEMHLEDVAERYTLLLETYLRGCGLQLRELMRQHEANTLLVKVAEKVKLAPSSQKKNVLIDNLSSLQLPESFQLPLDQRVSVSKLKIEKCKYMDSKKLPLWLVWENLEPLGKPISVIFKVGDDLRQDALTLQIIRIFDKIWKNEGLDLLLNPYGCIATGDEIGMIEVVKNADTTANINKAAGGTAAVLRVDTLTKWLKKANKTSEKFAKAQETFALSCAGYCVATFVLGIGDRHNDNIMLTRDGNLFHIDFGHFLGNYKTKYGFKRERAPFIFTHQYAHILDGKNSKAYQLFVNTACKAFNILRRHKDTFITLFQMMLCTGIPELGSADDIDYLRNAFALGKTDDEAAAYFKKLISSSLNTKTTVINDVIHVFVHR